MANEIFDKETLLDLTVNAIPLFIIAFFVVGFAVYPAFGTELLPTALQFGLLAVPFVLLAVLTYLSGKAIAGAEKNATVFPPGQATVAGVSPLHEEHESEAITAESETSEGDEQSVSGAETAESDGQ